MINQSLELRLKYDRTHNLTPDQPRLRFGGPIKVFLYGRYTVYKDHREIFEMDDCHVDTDWKVENHWCRTKDAFVLFDNKSFNSKSDGYPQYVPETTAFLGKCTKHLTSAPLTGKMLSVSLRGLQALDNYYGNTICFNRKKVELMSGSSAWMYVAPERTLVKYNPHTSEYSVQSHLQLERSKLTTVNELTHYGIS